MYCINCGTKIHMEDMLFGGCCQWGCSNCHFAHNCKDFFTGKIRENTRPIFNPIKAIVLRRRFKKGRKKVQKDGFIK